MSIHASAFKSGGHIHRNNGVAGPHGNFMFIYLFIYFVGILGFELRALKLLGRCSIAQAMPPAV
jgi:hypothetical protein